MSSVNSISRSSAWAVWMVASIFYAYQYILRVMPNIMLDDIMQQFGIGAATFGQFSGVYYIGYSLMHLPIGIMLDRFGPRKVMTGCTLLTAIGMLPLVFTSHWIGPVVGRALVGMGSSAAILGVFKVIRMAFSEERFPRMLSISVTIGLIGAIYGGAPVDYMRETMGYEAVIKIFALVGIALAAVTYYLVPETQVSSKSTVSSDVKEVLSNGKVIWACIFAGLMVGPLEGFADVWGTLFFKQVYGFDGIVAASLPSMMFVGMCFGSPILTMVAEKMGCYLRPVVGAGVVMAVSFFVLLFGYLTPGIISASFFVVGVCCAYQILAIYKVSTYVREDVAGLATALANMIIMTFGYLFHGAIGAIVNMTGGTASGTALVCGITVIPVALCIGTVGFSYLSMREGTSQQNLVTSRG